VFELPKDQELTKDQRMAIRKSADGQYLIVGAPGTGKSVVALLRLKKYANDGP
jgi:DNA helicase IV